MKTNSAKLFRNDKGEYIFPFEVLDKTPGGRNLGRIEWLIEPIVGKKNKDGRYYIEKLLIQARQTRDKRYIGKLFEIPVFADSILGDTLGRESYINYVWRMMFCPEHKTFIFDAYPGNNHKALKISCFSTMGIDINFI